MKKVLVILMIVLIFALIGTTIFLAYTIQQNEIEISKLKNNAKVYENEINDYKNKNSDLETKLEGLNKHEFEATIKEIEELNKHENDINVYINKNRDLESKIEQLKKIVNIKSKDAKYKDAKYEIVKNLPGEIQFDKINRGYEIIEYNNEYYVIIKMGEQTSGGYDIEVVYVEANEANVNIYVEETNPVTGRGGEYWKGVAPSVMTYPYVAVKFDFKPNVSVEYI